MKCCKYVLCLLPALLLTAAVCSCRRGMMYHQYADVPTWGWTQADTLHFVMPEMRGRGQLAASVGVRSTSSYPYRMLHLLTTVTRDDGVVVQADTVYVVLYDAQGRPVGQGFPYTTTMKPLPPLHVDSGRVYTYSISHVMKDARVKGIVKLGLEVRE